jgi:hypothetical protein
MNGYIDSLWSLNDLNESNLSVEDSITPPHPEEVLCNLRDVSVSAESVITFEVDENDAIIVSSSGLVTELKKGDRSNTSSL